MPKGSKKYRANVAVFVVNRHGEILVCERSDYDGAWQIPQGGIEKGEKLREAAIRELYEEIGTCSVGFLAKIPGTFRYDWPKALRKKGIKGQEQTFFIFRISPWAKIDLKRAARKDKNIKQEFRSYEFLPARKFLNRINGFKKKNYSKALSLALKKYPTAFESQK